MDVRCERCKAQYDVDDGSIPAAGLALQCNQCSHVFLVKKKELVVTVPVKPGTLAGVPVPASAAGRRTQQVPAASDPVSEYRVKLVTGEIFPCRDLTTLQKWVVERRIGRDDEVAPPGQSYKKLAELPELDTFFEVVDAADRAPAQSAAPAQPPRGPPPRKTVTRVTAMATPAASPSSFDVDLDHGASRDLDAAERAAIGGHGLRNTLLVLGALVVIVGGAGVLEPGLFAPLTALFERPAPPSQAAAPAPAPEPVNPPPPAVAKPAAEPTPKPPEPAPAAEATPAPPAPAPEKAPAAKGPKALVAQAEKLRQKGDVEKAMDLFDRAVEADPENADALAGRGLCYLDLEQYEAAARAFRETLRVDPEHADALLGAAEAARSQGRAAEAIQHYRKYLEFHPDGDEAAVARNALQELGR